MINKDVSIYEDALVMAIKAHDGQRRESGEPYICHPVRVAGRVYDLLYDKMSRDYVEVARCVAVLHDVLEDTPTPSCDIEAEFGSAITRAVELLTRPPKEYRTQTYAEWIDVLIGTGNRLAIAVKTADVMDNLSDIDSVPTKEMLRPRYEKALAKLQKALA